MSAVVGAFGLASDCVHDGHGGVETVPIEPIAYREGALELIDQRRLPEEQIVLRITNVNELADAIRTMAIRGAPSIGIAAAYGVVLGLSAREAGNDRWRRFREVCELLAGTRPTAVNLTWALGRMKAVFEKRAEADHADLVQALLEEARCIHENEAAANRRIGQLGVRLVPQGATILTHCNAGALATGGYGTALGIVRAAWECGTLVKVLVDETRPRLQGARLTAWELAKDGIPHQVIVDGAAASLMARGEVDLVLVGADRIAGNGDVANKIGTYSLAVLSRHHRIPFYVAAPISTIDSACLSGGSIPIEERPPDEVRSVRGVLVMPTDTPVRNPAFDVTPHALVSGIVTECGILTAPFEKAIDDVLPR
ncbi:S-methyl-5-thioribose-1-phosphate isomerase [Candidatus Bipolaricaulota bacterium]